MQQERPTPQIDEPANQRSHAGSWWKPRVSTLELAFVLLLATLYIFWQRGF